jgi:cytochrome c oxidase subunit 4
MQHDLKQLHAQAGTADAGGHAIDHHEDHAHEPQPYFTFVAVWIALMILTCITVGASILYPGTIGTAIAMTVTPIKAGLVLFYFMHLKWEPPVFRIMFLVTVAILATFMGLSFFDYLYR